MNFSRGGSDVGNADASVRVGVDGGDEEPLLGIPA